jgi:hypothetical protein
MKYNFQGRSQSTLRDIAQMYTWYKTDMFQRMNLAHIQFYIFLQNM